MRAFLLLVPCFSLACSSASTTIPDDGADAATSFDAVALDSGAPTSDGTSDASDAAEAIDASPSWTVTPPEKKGDVQPMSCAWLDGDNCWKQLVDAARGCAPSGTGAIEDGRASCRFGDESRFETATALPTLSPDAGVTYFATHARDLDPKGARCMQANILGLGLTAFTVGDRTVLFHSTSLTNYELTCPDGTTYTNDAMVAGVCDGFGARWLGGHTPGVEFTGKIDGSSEVWSVVLKGGALGATEVLTCRR